MSMTCRSRRDSAGVSGCFFMRKTIGWWYAEKSPVLIFQRRGGIVKGECCSSVSRLLGSRPTSGELRRPEIRRLPRNRGTDERAERASLVPQRLDRIQPSGAARRDYSEKESDHHRDPHRDQRLQQR